MHEDFSLPQLYSNIEKSSIFEFSLLSIMQSCAELQAVQSEMAAALAAESCSTYMHPGIFTEVVICTKYV